MRGKVSCIVIVALAAALAVQAGGDYQVYTITSDALGEERSVAVYLPEGYTPIGGEGFPVIYYFAGDGSTFNTAAAVDQLDAHISEGLIDPVIVVEPDSHWIPYPDVAADEFSTLNMNSSAANRYRDWIVGDLIPWVDDTFNTTADRSHRSVTGHCLGAYGAWRLAIERPDLFSSLSSMQGSFEWEFLAPFLSRVQAEAMASETPPYEYLPENGFATRGVHAFARLLMPNPGAPRGYDFPLDPEGNLDTDVWQRLLGEDIGTILRAAWPIEHVMDMYMAVGLTDMQVGGDAEGLAAVLDDLGIPYVFRTYPGGHQYNGRNAVSERFLIHTTFHLPIKATAELSPRVADPRLYPQLLRVAVELPGELDVAGIDCSTLTVTGIDGNRLDCPIGCTKTCEISDVNGNGRDDLSVWLPCDRVARAAVAAGAKAGNEIELTIRGELVDDRFFQATDTVTLGALTETAVIE
jgi:enterochelin esterase-like enzyme